MTRIHLPTARITVLSRTALAIAIIGSLISSGCTTNYLTNSTEGAYGVPVTERTIPQRLLDRSIEHTAKINAYGLQQNLQENSRMAIDSFYSEVLLSGEVPTETIKSQVEQVIRSMPDVREVYNELIVSPNRGYTSTVQDGYITSKLSAKVLANSSVKSSQIKLVTNNGVVYVMGRMTPTQQSHLIDIANTTVGVTEVVLLIKVVNDRGAPIDSEDIMSETIVEPATSQNSEQTPEPLATPRVRDPALSNQVAQPLPPAPNLGSDISKLEPDMTTAPSSQSSSSPYIELYRN